MAPGIDINDAPVDESSAVSVTITDPGHPLTGQTFPLREHLRDAHGHGYVLVDLPTGSSQALLRAQTSLLPSDPPPSQRPLLALEGLRHILTYLSPQNADPMEDRDDAPIGSPARPLATTAPAAPTGGAPDPGDSSAGTPGEPTLSRGSTTLAHPKGGD